MARKKKILLNKDGIDKREIGYYSTPSFVSDYLTTEMLKINPYGKFVLDPSVGKEELLKSFYDSGKLIDSFDVIKYLDEYKYSNFILSDFISYYADLKGNRFFNHSLTKYDYMIANPPYNCHEVSYIKDNKKWLNSIFEVGAYNMYSMFLSAMITLAKDGCLIGVLISDSFLTSTYHSKLREQIFGECSIHQIILCPSDLFWEQSADVRTCILILQKGRHYQGQIQISDRPNNTKELISILSNHKLKSVSLQSIRLSDTKLCNQILIDVDQDVTNLFHTFPKLGDIYKCVTCISTGNDEEFLSVHSKDGFSIPFYKNPAQRKFKSEPDCYLKDNFMDESLTHKTLMVRNKKLLFHEGIACSSMGLPFSAVYLPKNGVTGVNPTIYPPLNDLDWLISYLNSSLVTYLVRGVLIRSNMVTSGYVSCLPLLDFEVEEKEKLKMISLDVRQDNMGTYDAIRIIDNIIYSKGLLSPRTIDKISSFVENIYRRV